MHPSGVKDKDIPLNQSYCWLGVGDNDKKQAHLSDKARKKNSVESCNCTSPNERPLTANPSESKSQLTREDVRHGSSMSSISHTSA